MEGRKTGVGTLLLGEAREITIALLLLLVEGAARERAAGFLVKFAALDLLLLKSLALRLLTFILKFAPVAITLLRVFGG